MNKIVDVNQNSTRIRQRWADPLIPGTAQNQKVKTFSLKVSLMLYHHIKGNGINLTDKHKKGLNKRNLK